MKKDNWEDINVNPRSTDKIYFESTFIQSISDKIDFLRDESKEILKELDSTDFKQNLDDFDLEEFSEDTIHQIDDVFDDISRFKDTIINPQDFPHDIKNQYNTTKQYFNRDGDYVRRAKRKLNRLDSGKLTDSDKTNSRAIELCDKAIEIRPDNFDAYSTKARALTNLKRYDDAIEEYISALSIKDDLHVWLAIANLNRLNGEYEDALQVYDFIIGKYGTVHDALRGKAFVYFDDENFIKCDEMFKKANAIKYLDEESFRLWSDCLEKLSSD